MNAQNCARFFERAGYKVIECRGNYWLAASRYVFVNIPPDRRIDPSDEELREILSKHPVLGVKFSSARDRGKVGCVYLLRDKGYGLDSLHRTCRARVRKSLEHCEIKEVDFDHLEKFGRPLNRDSLERQQRKDRHFEDSHLWARFCRAGRMTPGVGAWGAFVEGKLAAYLVGLQINSCYHIVYHMSRRDLWAYSPNHTLLFLSIKKTLAREGIDCISAGLAGILPNPGLDRFKRHLGFQKEPVRSEVVLRPVAERLFHTRAAGFVLRSCTRIRSCSDLARRTEAILEISERSRNNRRLPSTRTMRKTSLACKRLLDCVVASIGILISLPLMLAVAVLVKIASPGPILYRGRRMGRQGEVFEIWKFRTMTAGADNGGPSVTYKGDARVTPLGRLLRRHKIDEFPQLFNVLRGDMSLVGPRPEDPRYRSAYAGGYRRILDVRPGMTSLAWVRFRRFSEENIEPGDAWEKHYTGSQLPVKLAVDLEYVDHCSLRLDFRILAQTLVGLLKRDEATEQEGCR